MKPEERRDLQRGKIHSRDHGWDILIMEKQCTTRVPLLLHTFLNTHRLSHPVDVWVSGYQLDNIYGKKLVRYVYNTEKQILHEYEYIYVFILLIISFEICSSQNNKYFCLYLIQFRNVDQHGLMFFTILSTSSITYVAAGMRGIVDKWE